MVKKMKNKDIYNRALALLGETAIDGVMTGNASNGVPAELLHVRLPRQGAVSHRARLSASCSPLEAVLGDSDAPAVRKTPAALDDDLQVDSRFADAIAFRLAGLLVLNESREKADSLFDGYKTQIDAVRAALTSHDKITEADR